jgi:hypothetical protein
MRPAFAATQRNNFALADVELQLGGAVDRGFYESVAHTNSHFSGVDRLKCNGFSIAWEKPSIEMQCK